MKKKVMNQTRFPDERVRCHGGDIIRKMYQFKSVRIPSPTRTIVTPWNVLSPQTGIEPLSHHSVPCLVLNYRLGHKLDWLI